MAPEVCAHIMNRTQNRTKPEQPPNKHGTCPEQRPNIARTNAEHPPKTCQKHGDLRSKRAPATKFPVAPAAAANTLMGNQQHSENNLQHEKRHLMTQRQIGTTDIKISPVALGCWPIAGMTSPGVNDADSLATLEACFELGINFLDTAYSYGTEGESEKLIAQAVSSRRDEVVIATKGGLHWTVDENGNRKMDKDARPETLRRECEESLTRLGTDRVELLYLHAPDPDVPVAESAGELSRLLEEGKTRSVGASNLSLEQLQEFAATCPLSAYQPPYNMIQRDIEADILPWCRENNVSVMVYWPLMKGLLAGKLARDHQFAATDSRNKYSQFKGEEWEKNHTLVDELREIAATSGHTVAQLVVNWTIHQAGITGALCGAKRAEQIRETAGGMGWELSLQQQEAVAAALARRGKPAEMKAV